MTPRYRSVASLLFALAALAPSIALAENLQARPGDPAWMHLGANVLLWAHIAGGAIGMVTGVIALAARKGQRVHRAAGSVFFLAMFTAYAIGAGVAPFLQTGQRPNFVAGVMALYLLISGTMAARLRDKKAGAPEVIGLIIALCITAAGVTFMRMGAASPSGTVDGSPPQAFLLFTIAGVFAAAGEAHALLRKQLSRTSRIARHLWRMCFSLFIASGSFFLGQQQVFPKALQDSALLYVAALAPLPILLFWLGKVYVDEALRRRQRAN
ncbi:hypothetical protein [Caulobacter vibrioides]|uniref:DUF2306 domain-containing protein n=2 Tax=Caulobacter vibrioides TaxID=155892 RepID=Q9AAG4_CAUVC|nr:hypothetical protein [Caulobacter vibrioides]YP_002516045.1 hypothetical protein CCNA_00672 [Caulobacter vibrioides NA1000]AAK22621.1 hypothetical protein CC_0636 [Caulobacter vibrioides CB15]ACL94137.1 hypothetical protein CCNA_00672 [Caulobacter vibrioides NA1000]ATC27480.1 hypothetical protein CA607_03390 [Caulobacter vibrioides]QXZ52715.1 hypothetical protein KZH45_03285 [Caulobacter vibrioides]